MQLSSPRDPSKQHTAQHAVSRHLSSPGARRAGDPRECSAPFAPYKHQRWACLRVQVEVDHEPCVSCSSPAMGLKKASGELAFKSGVAKPKEPRH
eukprot:12145548-Alexandrium_andersonii.AAC.1